jgi:hypothetical protein
MTHGSILLKEVHGDRVHIALSDGGGIDGSPPDTTYFEMSHDELERLIQEFNGVLREMEEDDWG